VSLTRRLLPSRLGRSPTSAYVYMPPKRRWWPVVAAFAAGGICVFAFAKPPSTPPASETSFTTPQNVFAVAPQMAPAPQLSPVPIPDFSQNATDSATAATPPPEPAPAAKATAHRTAAKAAPHKHVAKGRRYEPFSFARNIDAFGGRGRRYSGYGSYGFNAN
jgi:hypothetical protein